MYSACQHGNLTPVLVVWRLLQDTGQQGNDNIENANGGLITIMSELPGGAGDLLHLQVARDIHHHHHHHQLPAPSFALDLFWLLFTITITSR